MKQIRRQHRPHITSFQRVFPEVDVNRVRHLLNNEDFKQRRALFARVRTQSQNMDADTSAFEAFQDTMRAIIQRITEAGYRDEELTAADFVATGLVAIYGRKHHS